MGKRKTKVYILDLGVSGVDMNNIVAGTVTATASNREPKAIWDYVPIIAILIDHPEGKILYDLGCHPDALNGRWPKSLVEASPNYHNEKQTLEHQLALCSTKPKEIKTVILSHMHLDHAGYLFMFPHTNVIVHKDEFASALVYAFEQLDQEGHHMYLRDDITAPVDKYTLITEDTEVCDGVKLIVLPGHSAGMCGLQVQLEDFGTIIFSGDACYTAVNYGPPVRPCGFVDNMGIYISSIEKVRKLAKETKAFVVFGHDKEQFQNLKHAPEYYE